MEIVSSGRNVINSRKRVFVGYKDETAAREFARSAKLNITLSRAKERYSNKSVTIALFTLTTEATGMWQRTSITIPSARGRRHTLPTRSVVHGRSE